MEQSTIVMEDEYSLPEPTQATCSWLPSSIQTFSLPAAAIVEAHLRTDSDNEAHLFEDCRLTESAETSTAAASCMQKHQTQSAVEGVACPEFARSTTPAGSSPSPQRQKGQRVHVCHMYIEERFQPSSGRHENPSNPHTNTHTSHGPRGRRDNPV